MANITITDNAGLTADFKIRDDSPLAKAGLTQIVSTVTTLGGVLNVPLDRVPVRSITLGPTFAAPSELIANASALAVSGAASASLRIFLPADRKLFGDDPFAPEVAIGPADCWIAFEVDGSVSGALSGSVDGFGIGLGSAASVAFATYTLVNAAGGVFPPLTTALPSALENFSIGCTAQRLRTQTPGTVTSIDVAGSLSISASYALPVSVNALATADLPLNLKISVDPSANVSITGKITLSGDFVVRAHKTGADQLQLGVYKKRGTTLAVSLAAGAQLSADVGNTDLIGAVLGVALPNADPAKAGITGPNAERFSEVLQAALNRSLSIAVNLECAATFNDEAAVVYAIDLAAGDPPATDAALAAALRGDWTALEALPNARAVRNIVRHTKDLKHRFRINLLGVYNAASVEDFLRSSTVLHDGDGRVVITDTARATRLAVAAEPLRADPDKLRRALADAFLATVTYAATASLTVAQSHFQYENQLTRQEMKDAVLLGRTLGLVADDGWDAILAANPVFRHARIQAEASYDNPAASRLFFSDPAARVPHAREHLVRIGRQTMLALIDPGDPAGAVQRRILADDAAWAAMDQNGNTANFARLPELRGLSATDLAAVSVDWIDIAWWADAISELAPRLADLLAAIGQSDAAGPDLAKPREKVAGLLASVTRNTRAAFVGGWGLAVMFALSGRSAQVEMDLAWDGNARHYARSLEARA